MKNLVTIYLVLFSFLFVAGNVLADGDVQGYWKSIDENTNEVTAYWKLEVRDGKLYGYIVSYPDPEVDEKCDKCTGAAQDFYNKPILGTPWLFLEERTKKGVWKKGYIVDSGEGKKYTAKVWVEDENLKVRGYIAFLFRTQLWLKATKKEAEAWKF